MPVRTNPAVAAAAPLDIALLAASELNRRRIAAGEMVRTGQWTPEGAERQLAPWVIAALLTDADVSFVPDLAEALACRIEVQTWPGPEYRDRSDREARNQLVDDVLRLNNMRTGEWRAEIGRARDAARATASLPGAKAAAMTRAEQLGALARHLGVTHTTITQGSTAR